MKKSLFLLILALIGANSCRNNGTSPHDSGTIAGRVMLFDSAGTALSDFSGTSVSIDGTALATHTSSTGQFEFDNLADGMYDVTATKPGFGTFHWYEQSVNNGRLDLQTAGLENMPTFTPTMGYGEWDGDILFINTSDSANLQVYSYCDLDSTTQPQDPHLVVSVGYNSPGSLGCIVERSDLLAAGFKPGQTIYLTCSSVFSTMPNNNRLVNNSGIATVYFDPRHSAYCWASTGPRSIVATIIMQ
jgi:hypothetical protein